LEFQGVCVEIGRPVYINFNSLVQCTLLTFNLRINSLSVSQKVLEWHLYFLCDRLIGQFSYSTWLPKAQLHIKKNQLLSYSNYSFILF